MKTTTKQNYRMKLLATMLRFAVIALWFIVMSYAAYGGLFIHAFVGFASLTVLTYLTIKQADARMKYLKKRRIKQLSHYHVGEDYMRIFDANRKGNL